jgi:hypothetical protein
MRIGYMGRLLGMASLLSMMGCSSSGGNVSCEEAMQHRGRLMLQRQGAEHRAAIEAATQNEIDLCKQVNRPQPVLRCYMTVRKEDLDRDPFAFERCHNMVAGDAGT